jgi:hypothetical protein
MTWVEQRGGGYRVRLRLPDGTVVTDSAHQTKPAAQLRAKEIDVELGKDTFLDPRDGRITLTDWVQIWQATHQAAPATWSAYRSHLRLHILPRLGGLPLTAIRRQHIKALIIDLKPKLAPRSAADVIAVLSLVLSEAVEDRRIPHNPCRNIRVDPGIRPERPHATPAQVAAIAGRIRRPVDQAMVITAAYTGMRWGELAGLSRENIDLHHASIQSTPTSALCTKSTASCSSARPRPPTPCAASGYPRSSSPSSPRCCIPTPTRPCSAAHGAGFNAAPTSTAEPGPRPWPATPTAAPHPSSPACTSTTCATPTRPG